MGLDLRRMKAIFTKEELEAQHRDYLLGPMHLPVSAVDAIKTEAPPESSEVAFSAENLPAVRAYLESANSIEAISPDLRRIVESNWPDLVEKLPPEDD